MSLHEGLGGVSPALTPEQGMDAFNFHAELNPDLMGAIVKIAGGNPGIMKGIFNTMGEAITVGLVDVSDITPTSISGHLGVPHDPRNLDAWRQSFGNSLRDNRNIA